ncbi:Receptor-like protein kinase 5 [Acorus gramineus]|uniref:Receptor-like protein kinase 5 n=1 Tax=Acorus gramineus TaxID=55184 RepID=A0AAV9A9F3_ACOGR|nr:Receptor-like protein kinase 5 [Acorus gramineus]
MSEYTKTCVVWLLWFLLCVGTINLCLCNSLSSATCWEIERQVLLKLKAGLVDPANRLSTWTDEDCCRWSGVSCDNQTGHVVKIDLQNPYYDGSLYNDWPNGSLRGKIGPSLLDLKHLTYLDLSSTDFEGSIPPFIGSLSKLTYLNLSMSSFNGTIPPQLGNLSILEILDVGQNWFLRADDLQWLSGLLSLQHLDLTHVNLTTSSDWFHMIFKLPSLSVLKLVNCGLHGLPSSSWLFNISSLTHLHLRRNHFYGPIPNVFGNFINLEVLDLSSNTINSTIPHWIFNISSLTYLDLSFNNFNGQIPSAFEKSYIKVSLQILSLRSNNLKGNLPDILEQFRYLRTLDLSNNMISGSIPASIGRLSFLSKLYLSGNQLNGTVPNIIGQLSDLKVLDLAHNSFSFTGPIAFGNNKVSLNHLILSNNKINGSIPSSICKLEKLAVLDISNNQLSGELPTCWKNLTSLMAVNLENNNLFGEIPNVCHNHLLGLHALRLSNNSFSGEIPCSMKNCTSLAMVDLGQNKLHGNIPTWMGESLSSLVFLRLRSNFFGGTIPPQICELSSLQVLDLADNNLIGHLPECIGNFSKMIVNPNASQQALYIPEYIVYWGDFRRYIHPNYKYSLPLVRDGEEREYTNILPQVTNIDLSNNSLVGEIPVGVLSLLGLQGLNLSRNHLTGNIPLKIGVMRSMMTLDLSRNELSGQIPPSLSNLSFLNHLNLSFNNLSGRIPTGSQLQTLNDTSVYMGNSYLCGPPLPQECPGDGPSQSPSFTSKENEDEGGDIQEMLWFYLGIVSGFVLGCWMVWGVLFFKRSWRIAYFLVVDDLYDKVYVTSVLGIRRWKEMKGRRT